MSDLLFKDIELADSSWIRELFSVPDFNSEDYNFTYQYLWRNVFRSKVARVGDLALVQYNMEGRRSYLLPVGRAEDSQVADLLNSMLGDDSLLGDDGHLVFYGVLPSQLDFLERHFGGRFTAEKFRTGADYIYDAESLRTLRGKKYQAKRNFANGFRRMYDWKFEPVTESNIEECRQMNDEWCRRNGCGENFWKASEFCAVRIALDNFSALGLDGGLLRVDGTVVAFTIGERASSNTLLVHIEKALTEYRGAYQAMSQEFLGYMDKILRERENIPDGTPAFTLVNREDDSGDENLRKAKLEYHPIEIKEKYLVSLK
ncbi:MAG: DUF2156 domain-containing protein [Bacteroidales bacterium]|nr:DUF2156 domain-containing protein [Bacteroidales bacterium]